MYNPKLVLSQIRRIYVVHKKWLADIQKIQTSSNIPAEDIDFSIEDCAFCKWYSNPLLRKEYQEELEGIEKHFKNVHHIYQTVKRKGFITNTIGDIKYYSSAFDQLNAKDQSMILAYFKDLKNEHHKISSLLRKMYRRIGENNMGKQTHLIL